MDLGVFQFSTDSAMPIGDLAREVENRGFESLWIPEHTHIPTSRKTPFPGGTGIPEEYKRTLDPFVALSHAAACSDSRLPKEPAGADLVAASANSTPDRSRHARRETRPPPSSTALSWRGPAPPSCGSDSCTRCHGSPSPRDSTPPAAKHQPALVPPMLEPIVVGRADGRKI